MTNRRVFISLQHFAEASGGGTANGTQQAADTGTADDEHKPTFDDMLMDKDMQSEFDKRISKALETAKEKNQPS